MVWEEYHPKPWEETDVDIQITHCGVCRSDINILRSGWGPTNYPCVVGHEIIGNAVRVGQNVEKGIKVGDRLGVGAQCSSCLKQDCEECTNGRESYCPHIVFTYITNTKYLDGSSPYGGYANYCRVPSHFAIKIPDGLSSEHAAPLLCAGITVFSALSRHGAGPGKRVGIVGIGGLGHLGVMFAKALGADKVIGISRSAAKKDDVMAIGTDEFIATNDDRDWATKYERSMDLIISTVSSGDMPLTQYLRLLRTFGHFIQLGAPEENLSPFSAFDLLRKGVKIGGSAIGSPHEIEQMLRLAAEKNIKPWIQKRPLKEANEVVVDMWEGKARYRYVLVNEHHAEL